MTSYKIREDRNSQGYKLIVAVFSDGREEILDCIPHNERPSREQQLAWKHMAEDKMKGRK